jgi:glycosyltransferase involved in cell wall biosynthesis
MAIAHEWLASRAGSEKTYEAMAEAFPQADLYALTATPGVRFEFGGRRVQTTLLDRTRFTRERRELTLPVMPLAWRTIPVHDDYRVVLTSSHACVRAFPPARKATHFCYVHAPMRYAWDPDIDSRSRLMGLPGMGTALSALRRWDARTARTVDHFAANSTEVAGRIRRFYGRESRVLHPPVDVDWFTPPAPGAARDRVLAVSRFIPYKRLDLVIEACALARLPLTVAGSGPDESRLRALAEQAGADVRFEISPSDERLRELYRGAIALVFPALEDFGIVPVEAQACGTPVIGIDQGGLRDTVVDGRTGYLVARQDARALAEAVERIAREPLSESDCRQNAERFSRQRFMQELREWIQES